MLLLTLGFTEEGGMLRTVSGQRSHLTKSGHLAKQAGVLPSTIRYYVMLGLLQPSGSTPGGYNLFNEAESLRRLRLIQQLKDKERLTLAEIQQRLQNHGGFNDHAPDLAEKGRQKK